MITDAEGKTEEVRGAGVVGHQPVLRPGAKFEYTSGTMLRTPRGTMRGSYGAVRDDGSRFEVQIGLFELLLPASLN